MTEHQRLFLKQARSNMAVFELLREALLRDAALHHCHALHYLQMATELLGKAAAWRTGPKEQLTHRALVSFFRTLVGNGKAQRQLGYEGKTASWQHLLRKSEPLAERIEDLAPALAKDGPNPEYPWPPKDPEVTPTEYRFVLWFELTEDPFGRQFLQFVRELFKIAEAYI
jgi:hypothetical protein